jgi:two-component system, LytTR family, response regulator
MKQIRAIIIDDEADARDIIRNNLRDYCEGVDLVGVADGVVSGLQVIKQLKPDLIFLDIQMGDGTGFDLLNQLDSVKPQIIFTTAYDAFAIKAFKYATVDYLLKPIDIDELIDATKKVEIPVGSANTMLEEKMNLLFQSIEKKSFDRISLATINGFQMVDTANIVFCKADGNYSNFYLKTGERIMVTKIIKEFEQLLSPDIFFRIHQSHIVNLKCINRYIKGEGGVVVMSDGTELEVSRRRKKELISRLSQ